MANRLGTNSGTVYSIQIINILYFLKVQISTLTNSSSCFITNVSNFESKSVFGQKIVSVAFRTLAQVRSVQTKLPQKLLPRNLLVLPSHRIYQILCHRCQFIPCTSHEVPLGSFVLRIRFICTGRRPERTHEGLHGISLHTSFHTVSRHTFFVWQTGLVRVNVVVKVVLSPFGIGRKRSIGRVGNRKVEAFLLDDVIVGQLDASTCKHIIRSKTKLRVRDCGGSICGGPSRRKRVFLLFVIDVTF